jgi:hypothetical protein
MFFVYVKKSSLQKFLNLMNYYFISLKILHLMRIDKILSMEHIYLKLILILKLIMLLFKWVKKLEYYTFKYLYNKKYYKDI